MYHSIETLREEACLCDWKGSHKLEDKSKTQQLYLLAAGDELNWTFLSSDCR